MRKVHEPGSRIFNFHSSEEAVLRGGAATVRNIDRLHLNGAQPQNSPKPFHAALDAWPAAIDTKKAPQRALVKRDGLPSRKSPGEKRFANSRCRCRRWRLWRSILRLEIGVAGLLHTAIGQGIVALGLIQTGHVDFLQTTVVTICGGGIFMPPFLPLALGGGADKIGIFQIHPARHLPVGIFAHFTIGIFLTAG